MEKIDEHGKWIIENGAKMLVEPSKKWVDKRVLEGMKEIEIEPKKTLEERVTALELAIKVLK